MSPVPAVGRLVPQMLAGLELSCSPSLKITDILKGTTRQAKLGHFEGKFCLFRGNFYHYLIAKIKFSWERTKRHHMFTLSAESFSSVDSIVSKSWDAD